jgi:membrane protein
MRPKEIWELVKDAGSAWSNDRAPRMGAAIAYYAIFSISPLLVISIGIASAIWGQEAAQSKIVEQIEQTVGKPTAEAIQGMLTNAWSSGGSVLSLVLGFIVLLFGASGVFVELQDALNTIWKVQSKQGHGILHMIRDRLLSFTVVLGTGFLLLVSLIVSTALSALSQFITPSWLPGGIALWQGVNLVVTLLFITLLFAMIFKLLPDTSVAWRDVWISAILTALLLTGGKYLLGLYIGKSGVTSTFGAAGSLVLILLWVYYSAQILLFGAEFAYAYAKRKGSKSGPSHDTTVTTPRTRASMQQVQS